MNAAYIIGKLITECDCLTVVRHENGEKPWYINIQCMNKRTHTGRKNVIGDLNPKARKASFRLYDPNKKQWTNYKNLNLNNEDEIINWVKSDIKKHFI